MRAGAGVSVVALAFAFALAVHACGRSAPGAGPSPFDGGDDGGLGDDATGMGTATDVPLIPVGLDAYRQWDRWPYLRLGMRANMRSTYDRTGGNFDSSHFLRLESDRAPSTGTTWSSPRRTRHTRTSRRRTRASSRQRPSLPRSR